MRLRVPGLDPFLLLLIGTVAVASILPCRGQGAVAFGWITNAAIALLFFGPQKLPELGKGLAQGIRSFKDSLKSVNNPDDTPPAQPKD